MTNTTPITKTQPDAEQDDRCKCHTVWGCLYHGFAPTPEGDFPEEGC